MNPKQLLDWLRLHWRRVLALGALLALAWFAGQKYGNYASFQQIGLLSTRLDDMQKRLNELTTEQTELQKQHDYLSAELAVEKNAAVLLQQELKLEQQNVFDAKKELAFYQRIISPDQQAQSIIIDNFTLTPGAVPGNYRFNLVLIQQDKQRQFAKGTLELRLIGKVQDKKTEYDVLSLAGFKKSDKAFSFKYFQILEGEFTLPANLAPEKVDIQLKVAGARGSAIEKSFFWPTNLTGEILE